MVNFSPLAAEIGLPCSLGHPSKFQLVSRLGFVTAQTSLNGGQPNFARCLAVSWAATLYIHFRGLLRHNGVLPCAKFTFRPSLTFSYIGSFTARHSSSGRQLNFAVFSRGRHLYLAGRPSRWTSAHILFLLSYKGIVLKSVSVSNILCRYADGTYLSGQQHSCQKCGNRKH